MQEAHGSRAELKEALQHELQDYRLFHSPGSSRAKGGTATLISKSFLGVGTDAVMETYAEGRIHRIHICDTEGTVMLVVWSVHYFDIASRTSVAIIKNMKQDNCWAANSPLSRAVLILGDINFNVEIV